jgi:hypothetical protein
MSVAKEEIRISGTQLLIFALLFSVAMHFTLLFLSQKIPATTLYRPAVDNFIEIDLVAPRQVVESSQEASLEAPENAEFISEKNLRTDVQTSPELQERGADQQESVGPMPGEVMESFSLSSSDFPRSNPRERPTSEAQTPVQKRFSPEFIERLERGEELKLNALGLDYAGYVNRMRERIRNRWDPMRYFQNEMRRYNRVSTTVVLILDSNGEVKNWDILSPTLFRDYDQHAMDVLIESGPYPNPPSSLIQDDGLIYLTWNFVLYTSTWGALVE